MSPAQQVSAHSSVSHRPIDIIRSHYSSSQTLHINKLKSLTAPFRHHIFLRSATQVLSRLLLPQTLALLTILFPCTTMPSTIRNNASVFNVRTFTAASVANDSPPIEKSTRAARRAAEAAAKRAAEEAAEDAARARLEIVRSPWCIGCAEAFCVEGLSCDIHSLISRRCNKPTNAACRSCRSNGRACQPVSHRHWLIRPYFHFPQGF